MAKLFTTSGPTVFANSTNTNTYNNNSSRTPIECCSKSSCCSNIQEGKTAVETKYNKFFSNYSDYQNKFQQLISFSFTSTNFIFITFILSLSKICTTAATDPAHAATSAPTNNAPNLGSNFNSSVLLEKLNALRHTTFGERSAKEPAYLAHKKNPLQFDFKFLNISGKIGTPLGIAENMLNKCGDKQFQCGTGQCIPVRYVCDGESDCPDQSDEIVPECNSIGSNCKSNEFRCSNGNCIPTRWLCDMETDCSDGADELPQHCKKQTCAAEEFACKSSEEECIPLGWVCDQNTDCSDGSDEEMCTMKCRADEFACANGRQCIQKRWVCDHDKDCRDGSDELACSKPDCDAATHFKCKSGLCIMKEWVCDGDNDCGDASDEEGCIKPQLDKLVSFCSPGEFRCADKITCLERSWLCDGDKDCPDGDDESPANCPNVTCRPDQFKCNNNTCIAGSLLCDGKKDCASGEDEKDCQLHKETSCNATTQFNCGGGQCIDLAFVCDRVKHCPDGEDEPAGKCFINECASNNGGCMHSCQDKPIGYECKCNEGYKLEANGRTCADINECEDPSTCSQVCINRIGGYKCECQEGYIPHPNHHNLCKATEGHASLLLARRHDIRKISLEHWEMTSIVNDTKSATALDFVFRTGMIFWSDVSTRSIYKAPIDEGAAKTSVVKAHSVSSDGLAVDWIYDHIYFTDSIQCTIEMTNFDGSMNKILVKDAIDIPRSIALDPINGWMYWSDWGASPRIERAGMDGSHRTAIITYDVKWPNGLTLDLVRNRIYWVDGKLNTISSTNFDGSDRRLILYSTDYLRHPFSITTFEDYIYWSDWDKQTVFRANKFNGQNVEPMTALHMLEHPMAVHVYHPYRQPDGVNYCKAVNGHCSHLCLPAPKINSKSPRISCACPEGLKLMENGLSCKENLQYKRPMAKTPLHRPKTSRKPKVPLIDFFKDVATEVPTERPAEKVNDKQLEKEVESEIVQTIATQEQVEKAGADYTLITILCIACVLAVIGFATYGGVNHCRKQSLQTINFENPVYHRTTEDTMSLEKGTMQKMIAPTVDEELQSSHRKLFAQY